MGRISAQERREGVIRAAVAEFARTGYDGTSTAAIADRVGVAQPYLFRLFPDKKTIFVAALLRSTEDTRLAFERATDGAEGSERAFQAMTAAYARLISTRPETLLMQMQGYAVAAAADAQGDDLIGEVVRAGWMSIWETVHLSLGADVDRTTSFLACGMLGNTRAAMGLPASARKGASFPDGERVNACLPRPAGWSPWARLARSSCRRRFPRGRWRRRRPC
ncbi:TetR/AcrR family transcriptional regulator [Streptomyces sp. NPDC007162]|uniref:TetR/AcrR family transcriptional regulator n=1 Tax=Streptomyces sp. NPDC007162 TaxID=3156917 RepID=UPI0033F570AF